MSLANKWMRKTIPSLSNLALGIELVSKELNHLAAILHVYAGGVEFYEVKKKIFVIIF